MRLSVRWDKDNVGVFENVLKALQHISINRGWTLLAVMYAATFMRLSRLMKDRKQ